MDKVVMVGAVAGLILGILEKFIFQAPWITIIWPVLIGAVIGFVATKFSDSWGGLLGIGAVVGATISLIMALVQNMYIGPNVVFGAVTGLLIAALSKFVVPVFIKANKEA